MISPRSPGIACARMAGHPSRPCRFSCPRADFIIPADTPFLVELAERAARFAAHRSVFPSTTRASAASIATGCLPARHGLLGNTMALDEGEGLVCLSVGNPVFRDRL